MNQLFGYKNIKDDTSICLSKVKPDFQTTFEYTQGDFSLFLGGDDEKEWKSHVFENQDILIVLEGNIYLKKYFFAKYPRAKKFQDEDLAATIADLYQNYGMEAIFDLTGDFILIIFEKKRGSLIVLRDKMGGRKVYYTFLNGNIIFSSRIKSLISVPGISRDIDFFALESFLKFGYIIAPSTIFDSIKELGPGELLEISNGDYKIVSYWNLQTGDEIRESRSEIREMLYEKIKENISVRTRDEERIGIYLSGGIDSNTILAFLAKSGNPSDIETISIGYGEQYKDYHELNQARSSANYFGSNHHELVNGPEHIDRYLCKTMWEFEQPFGNPALISWTALSEFTKNLVDVIFVGAGADEVLGGYRRYNALTLLKTYYRIPFYSQINRISNFALGMLSPGANHYNPVYRLRKFFDGVESDILKTNEVFLFGKYDSIRKNILLPDVLKEAAAKEPTLDEYYQIADTDDVFKKIFIADCYTDLVSEQLTRALIPLSTYGIDYRAPFSDPDFMQMCLNIPDKYKVNLFNTKIAYKEAVSRFLPEWIINQKKRGMSHPVSLWFQGPLYEVLKSVLSSDNMALRNYFNIDYLRLAAEEHYSKKRDWGKLLWKMVVFSMWHKLFIEERPSSLPDLSLKDLSSSAR